MKNLSANPWPWLAGSLLALAGVALARLGPDMIGGHARTVVSIGRLVAVAGLGVIMLGVRRRIRQEDISAPDAGADAPAETSVKTTSNPFLP